MKLPPRLDVRVPARVLTDERDRRFLVFVGAILVALTLGFKSDLVPASQIWWLAVGLVIVASPALFAYLHGKDRRAALEHFIPVAIGAVVVAGLSQLITEWWRFALVSGAFGLGFLVAAQLDYRKLRKQDRPYHVVVQEALLAVPLAGAFAVVLSAPFPLALQALWIAGLALLASYRSFLVLGEPMGSRGAFLIAVFVAQVVGLATWALSSHLQDTNQGVFAVILLLVWYVNRGIFRHVFEDTLTRQVLLEYGAFAVLAAYLFFISIQR